MKEPTWNDFKEANQKELKKVYKLNSTQLEMAYRKHLLGANQVEMRKQYEKFYSSDK